MIVGDRDNVPLLPGDPKYLSNVFVESQECLRWVIEGAKKTLFWEPGNHTLVIVWGLGNSPLGVMGPQETLP